MVLSLEDNKPYNSTPLSQLRFKPRYIRVRLRCGYVLVIKSFIFESELGQCSFYVSVDDLVSFSVIPMTSPWCCILSSNILRDPYSMGKCNCLNAERTTETSIGIPLSPGLSGKNSRIKGILWRSTVTRRVTIRITLSSHTQGKERYNRYNRNHILFY